MVGLIAKRGTLIVVLLLGFVLVSGCFDDSTTPVASISSTSTLEEPLRPIDIICPEDLEFWKDQRGGDWLYTPLGPSNMFDCSGNSLRCIDCPYPLTSFVLTKNYNLTELEARAIKKGYTTTKYENYIYELEIRKGISPSESYWLNIDKGKPNGGGHDVEAYHKGECCLNKERIKTQIGKILGDLDLEYSGLNESIVERMYAIGPVT